MPMRCKLLNVHRLPSGVYQAIIERLDHHPKLGPPNGKSTMTSMIQSIDFRHGVIVTYNSIYYWDIVRDERD